MVAGDVVAHVRDLKGEAGGDIVQHGFGDLSAVAANNGLYDPLQWCIHPHLIRPGDAADLLYRPGPTATFELVDFEGPRQRIILATYRP